MPCRDYNDDNQRNYADEQRIAEQKLRLDIFARHLCFTCATLEKIGGKDIWETLKNLPVTKEHNNAAAEIEKWWTQHQKDDAAEAARIEAKRKKHEKIKREKEDAAKKKMAALSKLTKEDRAALGL